VSDLAASISRLLDGEGVLASMLVDATTNLVYGYAGDSAALPDPDESTETVHLLVDCLCEAGADGELESLIVTTARHHYLTHVVPRHRGDDLLLVTVADRARTNFALADRTMAAQADTVLA
jgi:hypothetical protein